MKAIIILVTTILMVACNKENAEIDTSKDYMYIDNKLDLIIDDTNGVNILNTILGYNDIDIVSFENGKEKIFYNPMLDASKGYFINEFNSNYYLRLFLNLPKEGSKESFTYMRIKQGSIKEFKSEFEVNKVETGIDGGSSIVLKRVWLNNTLFLDKTKEITSELPSLIFE